MHAFKKIEGSMFVPTKVMFRLMIMTFVRTSELTETPWSDRNHSDLTRVRFINAAYTRWGWLAIDECGGKLDMQPTSRPLNHWLDPIKPLENKLSSTPRVRKPPEINDKGTSRVPDG